MNRPDKTSKQLWREWLILAGLVVTALYAWLPFYSQFYIPNPDFIEFRQTAMWLFVGDRPDRWKRMPAWPAIFGTPALFLSVGKPYLNAALGLNLGLSIANLILLYKLSRTLIGPAGVVVPIALLATPFFSLMAVQPLLEPLMVLLILAAFLLMICGSGWAWVVVALGTLTRQEACLMLPILWAYRVSESPKRWWSPTWKAFLAGLPYVLWAVWTKLATTEQTGEGYIEEISGVGGVLWHKVALMLQPWTAGSDARMIDMMPIYALALLGLLSLLRRHARPTLAILAFFIGHNLIHLVFPFDAPRYAYPVLWVLPLFAVAGGSALAAWVWPWVAKLRWLGVAAMLGVSLVSAAWIANGWMDFGVLHRLQDWQEPWYFLAIPLAVSVLLIAVGLGLTRVRWHGKLALTLVMLALLTVPMLMGANHRGVEQGYYRYANVDYALIAQWAEQNLESDEVLLGTDGKLQYFDEQAGYPVRLRSADDLLFDEPERLHAEMVREGVDYIGVGWMRKLDKAPDDPLYEYNRYWYYLVNNQLFEEFVGGGDVEGFELIETIPMPPEALIDLEAVYIYRVLPSK
jgi:hypothetical protein